MGPIKRGKRPANQRFRPEEKLYRRVPPGSINSLGEIEPSSLQISFDKDVKSAPSMVRARYASPRDAIHQCCAGPRDVSSFAVFFLRTAELPKGIGSGDGKQLDFYPLHDPEETCYAHTVVACKHEGEGIGAYVKPSRPAKNAFKAQFVAALRRVEMPSSPMLFAIDIRKYLAAWLCH